MSKALEALKQLKMWATNGYTACKEKECEKIAEPIEKELKVIEIIRNKNCLFNGLRETTQEEFELLKEVLL